MGVWYYEHLGGQKPIVLVSEDPKIVSAFSTLRTEVMTGGVFVRRACNCLLPAAGVRVVPG